MRRLPIKRVSTESSETVIFHRIDSNSAQVDGVEQLLHTRFCRSLGVSSVVENIWKMRRKDSVTKPTVHLNMNIPCRTCFKNVARMLGVGAGTHMKTENFLYGQNLLHYFTLQHIMIWDLTFRKGNNMCRKQNTSVGPVSNVALLPCLAGL